VGQPQGKRALPSPTPETQPFWDAVSNHELHIQRCNECNNAFFPPRRFCPNPECFSDNVDWFKASGKGRLYSYVINQRPAPGFDGPYAIAVVELEEGPRMMTNIIGVENTPENLPLDMPVEVDFIEVNDFTLYQFRPAEA
jgi:uncharacterized OB-fold protein